MKFSLSVFAFIVLVPQAAWSACNLSRTTPSEMDTRRILTNADKAAITLAAKNGEYITSCDVSGVTDMTNLFHWYIPRSSFNQDISGWDVSNVTNMSGMFQNAYSFNQDISGWDVGNVTTMENMFREASSFNRDISAWNTSSVTNMTRAFTFTRAFNQDISGWDVSNVTSFFATFESSRLDQDITGWDVSSVTSFQGMFTNATYMNLRGAPDSPTSAYFSSNAAPVANAGPDQAVASGAAVTLTGAASTDADGDPITYLWSQTSGTTVSLSSSTAAQPTFTAPILNLGDPVSTLTFSLTVNDGTVSSALDTIIISIQAPTNNAPVANAGPDQAVASGAAVTLTGAASSDADGDPITYLWSQTSGTTVSLSSSTAAQPTFTAPVIDPANASIILTFSLVVNDGALTSAADTVTITVFPLTANAAFELVREDITTELARNARDQMLYLDRTARSLSASARNRYISSKLSRGLNISTSGPSADWTADLNANNEGLEGAASFGSRKSSSNGRTTRLFFADVNVVKDKTAKDSSHATALVQWEQSPNTNTLVGLFAGIRYGASNLSNSSKISVEQKYFGTQVGGYFVRDLSNGAYMDGYVAASTVNNDYDIKSDYISASSVFDQPSIAMGVSATGVVDYGYMQVKPSIAATVSKSFSSPIIFFVKTAGGSGNVEAILGIQTREVIDFAPEFVFPLTSPLPSVLHESIIEVTPNVFCERWGGLNSTSSCGQGLKVNLSKKLANKAQLEIGAYGTRQSGVNTNYVQASIALNF